MKRLGLWMAILAAAIAGCGSSKSSLRPRMCLTGRVALAPAVKKGDTHDYYLAKATDEMEKRLRDRKLRFLSPAEVRARLPEFFGEGAQGDKKAERSVEELVAHAGKAGIEALILFRLEVVGKTELVAGGKPRWIPHVGVGIGPVGIGTSVLAGRKPPTEKLFYSVDMLVNVFDTASGRAFYVTRGFESKATDRPEKMISKLAKKLAKRVEKALKERYIITK